MSKSKTLLEGDTVRIVNLLRTSRNVSGTEGHWRQPVVGDTGEVVALEPSIEPTAITVDCIQNGALVFSATFAPSELERID